MKRPLIILAALLLIFTQMSLPVKSQTTQSSFRLGFVKSFDDDGDSVWLANSNKEDQIDSKAIARFGFSGIGKININGRDRTEIS